MNFEEYLTNKLSRFSLLEYILVMLVYLVIGLLIASFYTPLQTLGWWFDLIVVVLSAFPLIVHLLSQPGKRFRERINSCLKHNTPALQVLLFISMFFFALFMISLLPLLAQVKWWIYVILIIVFAILPLRKSWVW